MEIQEFAAALQKEIRKDMNGLADSMANGLCPDYAEYKYLVGEIRGLALAEEHLAALVKKVKEDL